MAKTYLLSRTLDPILGVFTGILAFHLNETNPRSAPPEGHTLRELAMWKWGESKKLRDARNAEDEGEWERVTKELGTMERSLRRAWGVNMVPAIADGLDPE